MHHAALDGPGPHDGHLDDQVVKLLRLEARQHRHLRAALDLEDTHRVGVTDRFVDRRIFCRDRRERLDGIEWLVGAAPRSTTERVDEGQALANGGEHAEREHIDLEETERVEIVFVPGDDGAVFHASRLDGRHLGERLGREHEAPDVNGEMPRGPLEHLGERHRLEDAFVSRVEPLLGDTRGGELGEIVAKDDLAQPVDLIERKTEHLTHLAHGALASVSDDLGHHRRPIATIFRVDGLDHLFTAFVLEVDVDIGWLVPLGRQEPLEEQVGASRDRLL